MSGLFPFQEGRKTVVVAVFVNETKGWSCLNQRDPRLSETKERSIKSGGLEQKDFQTCYY